MPLVVGELVAKLTAEDAGLNSGLSKAKTQLSGLQSHATKVSSVAGKAFTGIAHTVGVGVVGALATMTAHLGSAVDRADQLHNFPIVMKSLGYSSKDAATQIERMSDKITGLPTSLNDMAGMVQKLAPLTGSLKDATDISLALNNALLAGGKSTQVQSNAMEQYAQMLSVGKVDMQAWRSIVDAMPGQMSQLSKALVGPKANTMDLYQALKEGTVSFDDFNNKIVQLNRKGLTGFASFAQQAKAATGGIGTQMANLGTAINRGMANMIDGVGYKNIGNIISGFTNVVNGGFKAIEPEIAKAAPLFKKVGDALNSIDGDNVADLFKKLSKYSTGIGATAGAIVGLNTGFAQSIPLIGKLVPALNPWVGALLGAASASPELRKALVDLVKAGTPLITVATNVATALAGLASGAATGAAAGIEGVAKVATPLVKILAAVPGPVWAGVAAFYAISRAVGPVQTVLGKLATSFSPVVSGFGQYKSALATATSLAPVAGISKTQAALSVTGSMAGKVGSSLLSAFGGPVGLAIGGISLAIGAVADEQQKAAQAAEKHKAWIDKLVQSLDAETGAYTKVTEAQFKGEASKKYGDLSKAGISLNDITKAAMGNTAAMERVNKKLAEYQEKLLSSKKAQAQMQTDAKTFGVSLDTVKDAAHGNADAIAKMESVANSQKDSMRTASMFAEMGALKSLSKGYWDASGRVKELQNDYIKMNRTALQNAFDDGSVKKQVTALQQLHEAYQTAGSGSFSVGVDQLSDSAVKAAKKADFAIKQYVDANGEVRYKITVDSSAVSRDIAKIQPDLDKVTKTHKVTITAPTENVIAKLKELGYQVSKPKKGKVTISTNADSAKAAVAGIQAKIKATKGKKITMDVPTDGVIKKLEDLGFKVKKIKGGKVTITPATDKAKKSVDSVTSSMKKADKAKAVPKVTMSTSSFDNGYSHVKSNMSSINGTKATTYIDTVHRDIKNAATGGAVGFAVGGSPISRLRHYVGSVLGPGTGTSDDIEARLSNGEHVSTASEVNKFGGQGSFYWLRSLISSGKLTAQKLASFMRGDNDDDDDVQAFAKGGKAKKKKKAKDTTVSDAKKAISEAWTTYSRQKSAANAQKKSLGNDAASKAAKKQIDDDLKSDYQSYLQTKLENEQIIANHKKASKAQRKAAKKQVAATNKALAAQAKSSAQADIDETNASNAATRASDRQSMSDTIAQSGTSALSDFMNGNDSTYTSALSSIANSDAYTDAQRKKARDTANASTAKMTALNKTLDTQKSKLDDLNSSYSSLKDSMSSAVKQSTSLSSVLSSAAATWVKNANGVWSQQSGTTAGGMLSYLDTQNQKTSNFASLVNQLIAKGFPTAMVQEVVSMGVDDGTSVANALLSMTDSQRAQAISDYNSIQAASDKVGTSVADQAYSSDIAAATDAVNKTTAQIEQTGKDVIAVLNGIYGTHYATGGHVHGPGSGTSDSILARISNGEFVMNAWATKQNLAALEYMNRTGKLPVRQFKRGGPVGQSNVQVAASKLALPPINVAVHAAIDGKALDDSMTVTATAVYDERAVQEAQQWEVQ